MSVQVSSSLDKVTNTAMSPITHLPQSGGAEPFSVRAKRAGSPQRISNGHTSTKSNGILSPKKTHKRFFRRNTLEKNQVGEAGTAQPNEKKKTSTPKVEIIYKDSPQSGNESDESNIASLKKTFEADGSPSLCTASTHSGERTPSTYSDEFIQSASLSLQGLDVNMNRISTGSAASHTERVVQEILSTERAYVQHLHDIIEGYLKKMRKKNSPFSKQDVKELFMNIEEIYEFNKTFLAELEELDDDPVEVASHFVSKEKGFKTYTDYCTNYPLSMEVLTKCTQQKETADFLKKIQVELGHSLPLGSYLLKPVQRILKYHLLLQDIQKHFDKENYPEGYDIISDALSAMTGVAHHINEMKRQHEQAVHVQEIQSQMSDFEGPDLTTYGSLVLEDTFRIHNTRTDRHLFLFEKILLITKRKEGGYSCKASLMLSNMMLSESIPKEPLAFEIIRFDNQKNSFVFLARNADQKRKWTLELKGLIVDSLTAQVPKEAKALILGKKDVKERGEQENHDNESKKRSRPGEKLNRGTQQLKALNNSRLLVTVTAEFVDVNRLRTSYSSIHRILEQTAFNNSQLELKRLDRIAYELANRNACFWLHQKLAKQYNIQTLEAVNRRINASLQGNLMNKMNLKSKPLNMERFSGVSSVPRNCTCNHKGSPLRSSRKNKKDTEKKSDDEGEPRPPSDVYSSDDEKKSLGPQSILSDREDDLEPCEEANEDESGVSSESAAGQVGGEEQGLRAQDTNKDDKLESGGDAEKSTEQITKYSIQDADGNVLGTAHEGGYAGCDPEKSTEGTTKYSVEDAQGNLLGSTTAESNENEHSGGGISEKPTEQTLRYSVQDSKGEVLGTAIAERDSGNRDVTSQETELPSSEKDVNEGNTVKRVPPIPRERSSSFTRCESLQTLRNRSGSSVSDDEAASERGKISPIPPRRTSSSGHRLLEARLSAEKSSSTTDLRNINEGFPSVFSHSEEITDLMEYSAIQTTVRKVSRAFSGSSPPPEKSTSHESHTQPAQSRYIVETRTSPGKESGSSDSSHNLDELLASIDRDLDETRRTISYAQLLESALLIKNDISPLDAEGQPTGSLRRRRRPRIVDFSREYDDPHSSDMKISSEQRPGKIAPNERDTGGLGATDSNTDVSEKSGEKTRENESRPSGSTLRLDDCVPQEHHEPNSTPATENTPVKKRVFELFADSNEKSRQLNSKDKESSEAEPEHVITPTKSLLPSVYQMARQYSKIVSDKQQADEIRMRNRSKLRGSTGSLAFTSGQDDVTDHTPKIKIEKITKVSFSNTPIESYKLVRRRRKRSGSSRRRSDDFRRQSWSVEKVKPDSEEPCKARPKSVYDMEALEETLTENLEHIEEGLEPMLIEGLDKDDVVVRGLVQHLVNKFNTQKNANDLKKP